MNDNGISIIIPVYNAEKYLSRCLDSLSERLSEDEIILINDGSIDRSRNICEAFQKKGENIKIIDKENSGVSSARNCGIQTAMRGWTMFVDADDYLLPGWRKILCDAMENYSSADTIIFEKNVRNGKISLEESISAALGYNHGIGLTLGFPFSKLYKTYILQSKKILFSQKLVNG